MATPAKTPSEKDKRRAATRLEHKERFDAYRERVAKRRNARRANQARLLKTVEGATNV